MFRVPAAVLVVLAAAWACSSSDDPSDGVVDEDAGADASAGTGGTGGSSGAGGSAGSDTDAGDASVDAPIDAVADVATDPFADAPPPPDPGSPVSIVLFGEMDGVDVTGVYDMGSIPAVACGPGYDVERTSPTTDSVTIRWLDTVVDLDPPVGSYDESDNFEIVISKFIKVDGSTKRLTLRAGQPYPASQVLGSVDAQDLSAAGTLTANFHVTKARRFVDQDEGIVDGSVYVWVAGNCK